MEDRKIQEIIPYFLDTNAVIHWLRKIGKKRIDREFSVTIFTAIEFPVVTAFPKALFVLPSSVDYTRSIEYACKLREKGTPIPAIDIIIATIVVERDAVLVSDDDHFASFNAVEPRLKRITLGTFLSRNAGTE
jgi:predicted nucleic acid-binding protein